MITSDFERTVMPFPLSLWNEACLEEALFDFDGRWRVEKVCEPRCRLRIRGAREAALEVCEVALHQNCHMIALARQNWPGVEQFT